MHLKQCLGKLLIHKSLLRCVWIFWTGFPGGSRVKNPPTNVGVTREAGLIPRSGRFPGGGNRNPLQYSWKSDCQRSLVSYSPWGHKELDVTEQLRTHTHTHTHTQPLQRYNNLSSWQPLWIPIGEIALDCEVFSYFNPYF